MVLLPPANEAIRRPMRVLPVKEIIRTSGCVTRASPALLPRPHTRLRTPAGSPTSSKILHSIQVVTVVISDGLQTTVLPVYGI